MRCHQPFALLLCAVVAATAAAQQASQQNQGTADAPVSPYPNRGWTEHFATLKDGTKLHYVEMGKGTPVILIHGAGGSAIGNWFVNGIAPALAKTNRVIGIDMRGHGLTESEGRGDMADDVLEFMDQQKITKAHIGGFSMGGGVTGSLLRKKPEVFLSAHFGGSGITEIEEFRSMVPPDKTGRAPDDEKASAAYASRPAARGAAVGNNAAALRGRAGARGEGQGQAAAGARRRGAAGAGGAGARAAAPPLDLSKIDIPFLVVNGEYDRPNAKSHRLWREGKTLTNVVLKDKGHLSAVMEGFIPQLYIDSMVAFITANNPKESQ